MGHYYNDDISPNSSMEHGLVVELPDGKLFKLSDPNGRVVEMPNGRAPCLALIAALHADRMRFRVPAQGPSPTLSPTDPVGQS